MVRPLSTATALVITTFSIASAQESVRVTLSFGVDTTAGAWSDASWHSAVPQIFNAWREYLQSNPRSQSPTQLWSAEEQSRWPAFDLTAAIAYQGFSATVLDIQPTFLGTTDEFVVKTLFATTGSDRGIRAIALTRVYAIQEDGRWVFSNALPRLTSDWTQEVVGAITYVHPPSHAFDRSRAQRARVFIDSLAAEFELDSPEPFTYYLATSPEELHRIMGVDWTFGRLGHGYAIPWNRLLLVGDVTFREENRHELVHYVLAPLTSTGRTHSMLSEGAATWLGGSVGRDFPELIREYARFLELRPEVDLDSILEANDPDMGWSPGGAILLQMVWERGGIGAVKEAMAAGRGNPELRQTMVKLLGTPWNQIMAQWRTRVFALAAADDIPRPLVP